MAVNPFVSEMFLVVVKPAMLYLFGIAKEMQPYVGGISASSKPLLLLSSPLSPLKW